MEGASPVTRIRVSTIPCANGLDNSRSHQNVGRPRFVSYLDLRSMP